MFFSSFVIAPKREKATYIQHLYLRRGGRSPPPRRTGLEGERDQRVRATVADHQPFLFSLCAEDFQPTLDTCLHAPHHAFFFFGVSSQRSTRASLGKIPSSARR